VLADALLKKEINNGFALVRPPGHHAMRVVHGNRGFCNINNEAIAIEYLRQHYNKEKIAIIDTDVHHGDGTQDIYWHDPNVLFISFHQDGRTLYPGTGYPSELGGPNAFGMTINVPLEPGTTDEGIHYVLENLVLPLLDDFKPDLIVNSAGQDNHYSDPLANMRVTAQGYARLNEKLRPDLAVLEGGYSIEGALPYVNTAIILAMAGLDYSHVTEPDYKQGKFMQSASQNDYIKGLVNYLKEIWKQKVSLAEQRYPRKDDFYEYNYSIYYDTDNIRESRQERVRLCQRCSGYQLITSSAIYEHGNKRTIFAVAIPQKACEACQDEARNYYREQIEAPDGLHSVFLQDRPRDNYRQFMVSRDEEVEY
jgi:hypothetical protein